MKPNYEWKDDEEHRPPTRAPWQRGSDLYEAYGRFLERMASGKIEEGDGGWADRTRMDSVTPMCNNSASYDRAFGYVTDEEAEEHNRRERVRQSRVASTECAERSLQAQAEHAKLMIGNEKWRRKLVAFLRVIKRPIATHEARNALGMPPGKKISAQFKYLKSRGVIVPAGKTGRGRECFWMLAEQKAS